MQNLWMSHPKLNDSTNLIGCAFGQSKSLVVGVVKLARTGKSLKVNSTLVTSSVTWWKFREVVVGTCWNLNLNTKTVEI